MLIKDDRFLNGNSATPLSGHCGWWEESASWTTVYTTLSRHRFSTDAEDYLVEGRRASRSCFSQSGISILFGTGHVPFQENLSHADKQQPIASPYDVF